MSTKGDRCFSRDGWWQVLCGLDVSWTGWTSDLSAVGCEECLLAIGRGDHERRPVDQVLYWPPASKAVEELEVEKMTAPHSDYVVRVVTKDGHVQWEGNISAVDAESAARQGYIRYRSTFKLRQVDEM